MEALVDEPLRIFKDSRRTGRLASIQLHVLWFRCNTGYDKISPIVGTVPRAARKGLQCYEFGVRVCTTTVLGPMGLILELQLCS